MAFVSHKIHPYNIAILQQIVKMVLFALMVCAMHSAQVHQQNAAQRTHVYPKIMYSSAFAEEKAKTLSMSVEKMIANIIAMKEMTIMPIHFLQMDIAIPLAAKKMHNAVRKTIVSKANA
jgi:hypothetical protein